jgi:hypothetical protein
MKNLFIISIVLILLSCKKTECKETNCNGAVTLDYSPVCGCNDITYSNPAEAECHGIEKYSFGECDN